MSAQNSFTCALPFMPIAGAAERTEHGAPLADSARVLAATLDAPVIEKILTHLGLPAPGAAAGFGAWATDRQLCRLESRSAKVSSGSNAPVRAGDERSSGRP